MCTRRGDNFVRAWWHPPCSTICQTNEGCVVVLGAPEGRTNMSQGNEKGFTLIELLVDVAIIGILAAIAIPQFSAYRAQGFNARASSDLRNLASSEEAYFALNAAYTGSLSNLTGFKQSPGVNISVTPSGTSFTATANHSSGNKTFTWDSANGGLQNAP